MAAPDWDAWLQVVRREAGELTGVAGPDSGEMQWWLKCSDADVEAAAGKLCAATDAIVADSAVPARWSCEWKVVVHRLSAAHRSTSVKIVLRHISIAGPAPPRRPPVALSPAPAPIRRPPDVASDRMAGAGAAGSCAGGADAVPSPSSILAAEAARVESAAAPLMAAFAEWAAGGAGKRGEFEVENPTEGVRQRLTAHVASINTAHQAKKFEAQEFKVSFRDNVDQFLPGSRYSSGCVIRGDGRHFVIFELVDRRFHFRSPGDDRN